ncbi:branched-chain amino acid ABC transporter permease [Cognatishimia sp.]|uniref:branched-chain amino acid ABC transporter permease n=1 Tax=Cognatishimia sp. TaxID=2211648 RepID=UPI003519B552
MGQFLQFAINGLMSGAIYALIALGIVAIYKATRVVNFAHGYVIMIGAYLYYTFAVLLPAAPWFPDLLFTPAWLVEAKASAQMFSPEAAWLAWLEKLPRIVFGLICAIIGSALLARLIERFLMRPLLGQSNFAMIMITVGLISVLSGAKSMIWTGDAASVPHLAPNPALRFEVFGSKVFIFGANLVSMGLALLIFAAIVIWLRRSSSGVAMRAASEDQSTAYSMGISVPRVFANAWVLAAATGAIAGAILAARDGVSPALGLFGFSVLAIVLMGGLDSFVGVFISAMAVGILEALAQWQLGGDWVEITPYVAVLIVILIRPHGLLGQKEIERI